MAISVFVRPNTPVRFVLHVPLVRRLRSVSRIFLRVQAASDSGEPPVQPAMPRLNTYFKMGLIVIFEESPPIVEPQGEGEVFNIVVFGGLACTCSRGESPWQEVVIRILFEYSSRPSLVVPACRNPSGRSLRRPPLA